MLRNDDSHWYYCMYIPLLFVSTDSTKFPREMFSEEVQQLPKNAPPPTTPLAIALNSEDNTFCKLRDKNFGAVGTHLSKFAKDISAAFQVREITALLIFPVSSSAVCQNAVELD